jgi:hypothetical protein
MNMFIIYKLVLKPCLNSNHAKALKTKEPEIGNSLFSLFPLLAESGPNPFLLFLYPTPACSK